MTYVRYPLWHGPAPARDSSRAIWADQLLIEGRGNRVRDAAGRWYLDSRSGLWNLNLGYSCKRVINAISEQLRTLPFATLLSYDRPAEVTVRYARALLDKLPGHYERVRFANSGSQAVECAVLLSRYLRSVSGTPARNVVIAGRGSYHGTGTTASVVSGCDLGQDHLGPLAGPVVHVDPTDLARTVTEALDRHGADRITAVVFEPLLGAGIVPRAEDLRAMAAICEAMGIHLIADEVTTGMGRTGSLSHSDELGIQPDLLVLAKGMTAGYVPVGAVAISQHFFDQCSAAGPASFVHGSTTDGHPLAAAAGLAVLDELADTGVLASVGATSKALRTALHEVCSRWVPAADVDGAGLMLRIGLRASDGTAWPAQRVVALRAAAERAGLLCSQGDGALLFLPPLITTENECDEIGDRLDKAFRAGREGVDQ